MARPTGKGIIVGITLLLAGRLAAADLYVLPDGNDANPGTREKPLATLAGARDAIRKLKHEEPVTVLFAAGSYFINRAVEFDVRDSGTAKAPISYQAVPGTEVRFTGGKEVTGWKRVADPAVLGRLPAEARGKVYVADLRAAGFADLGELEPRGFGTGKPPAEAELFFNDIPMTLPAANGMTSRNPFVNSRPWVPTSFLMKTRAGCAFARIPQAGRNGSCSGTMPRSGRSVSKRCRWRKWDSSPAPCAQAGLCKTRCDRWFCRR